MKFSPCVDQCSKEGAHCPGCGRSNEEVAETKKLVMALVSFAQKMEYENIEEFSDSIGKSILKKLKKAQLQR